MTIATPTSSHPIARRRFLQAAAAPFVLAAGVEGIAQTADGAKRFGAASMRGGTVDNPLVFVSIATDGTVTIVAHRAEMGTGVRTSLPMVVADELEARWDRVKVVQAPADEARFGNQNVDGSRSVRHFLEPMRRVGAAARQMLEAAAAARWSVPVAEVQAVQHEVLHRASGRRLGYGELAAAAGQDPLAFRLNWLKDAPRYAAVLQLAAAQAGWGKPMPAGRAQGIALHKSFGSIVAQVAEVSVTEGQIRVHRVVCAIDCGTVVNPDTVAQQVESSVLYGLSAALFGKIDIVGGVVQQSNFPAYPLVTLAQAPQVDTHIVPSTRPPAGVGEPAVPPVAPAVGNALFALTGKRLRALPLVV